MNNSSNSRIRTSTEYNNDCSYTTPKLPDTQRSKSKLFESFAINHKTVSNRTSIQSEQFNTNIEIINKQLNNIVLNDTQILFIPKVNQLKQKTFKRQQRIFSIQQVDSINIIGTNNKDLINENLELKDHVKFLLNQIKKLQKTNVASSKSIISIDDVSQLKTQVEENKIMIITMQRDHDALLEENKILREELIAYQTIKSRDNEEKKDHFQKNVNLVNTDNILQVTDIDDKKDDINLNDLSLELYTNAICNTNELFLMKLFKEDTTVLWFNKAKRIFSYDNYLDKDNSFNSVFKEDTAIYFTKGNYLYIITGNYFFFYDHLSHRINPLPQLQKAHSKGVLLQYENRLLCLSGMENEAVEEYLETNTWTSLPSLKFQRAEASYLILNKTTLYAFFGYDYKRRNYLSSIEYINLSENWNAWKSYSNLGVTIKKHNTFAALDDMIYLVGGQNDISYNCFTLKVRIDSKNSLQGIVIEKMEEVFPKTLFDSSFYEYLDIGSGDLTKISYDKDNNIHLINTVTLFHTTISYI